MSFSKGFSMHQSVSDDGVPEDVPADVHEDEELSDDMDAEDVELSDDES